MKLREIKKLAAVCALTLAVPAMGEIVTNGSFEAGTGTDALGWTQQYSGGPGATADIWRYDKGPAPDGEFSMYFGLNGSVGESVKYGTSANIFQLTEVGSIVGGMEYDFSFAGIGSAGSALLAVMQYQLYWYDTDGSHGGGPLSSATGLTDWTLTDDWSLHGMSGLLAPDAADSVAIQIIVANPYGGDMWASVDAVSMVAVPAPGALALLGLAGIANRRRRG